jgi:serine phosphatase RsbU (regulator of sigma subunit)
VVEINHNRLLAVLDDIVLKLPKKSQLSISHQSISEEELSRFKETTFDTALLLHIKDAQQWLNASETDHNRALPAGVIVWGESEVLGAQEILQWFHCNASDVIVMDEAEALLSQIMKEAMMRARRQRTLLQMSSSLFNESKKIQNRVDALMQDQMEGQKLQMGLLPEEVHLRGPLAFESFVSPALVLSGDFIDHFKIGDHCVGFYLADVAGHGVSAAIMTVLLKSYMSRYLMLSKLDKNQGIRSPVKIMTKLNHSILESGIDKHVTMIYGVIDYQANTLEYVNAGHFPHLALWDGGNDDWQQLHHASKPLGLFENTAFSAETRVLPEQYALLLSSDGLLEAFSDGSNDERMAAFQQQYIALAHEGLSLIEIVARLEIDKNNKSDDISILTIRN